MLYDNDIGGISRDVNTVRLNHNRVSKASDLRRHGITDKRNQCYAKK